MVGENEKMNGGRFGGEALVSELDVRVLYLLQRMVRSLVTPVRNEMNVVMQSNDQ